MTIELKERGRDAYAFEYREAGKPLGEITWTQLGDIMVMDHTFVDPSLRGQGMARQLLDAAASYARGHEYKMEAVCSYVVTAFNRYSEYDDVKA